jgi:signal transduction histidine kinase
MHRLRRWYEDASLQTKFALQVVISTKLLFAVLLALVLYLQRQAVLSNVEDAGFQLVKVFARSSVQAVVADDYLVMQHVVNGISGERKILYAMLLDENGRVLVHTRVNERGKLADDALSTGAIRSRASLLQRYSTPDGVPVYDFSAPVYVLDQRRATARVGISIQKELAEIARTRNYIILVGVVVLTIGSVWATYQARRITRPVGTLVRGTNEIARGNLDYHIPVNGGGELRQLASAFNRMTKSVQALIETSRQLSSTLDLDAVLRSVAAYALELVKADIAAIAPYDRDKQEARVKVVLGGRSAEVGDLVIDPERGMGGAVLRRKTPLISANYLDDQSIVHDPRYDAICRAEGVVSAVAVPITLREEIVGLLWVAYRTAKTFSPEDVDLLERMARQAAIAMENARLYQELKASNAEIVAAQEQLVHQTRMAAIGEISAAVAHEARNPLGAISNCVQMLRANSTLTGEDDELLKIVHTETQRLNEIVSDFLAFGRPKPPQFQPVEIHELVETTLALLRRDDRWPTAITVITKFDPVLPMLHADRDQLRQVLWNLFLNAAQAMGDNGELRVETSCRGDMAEILVQDTGPGITPSLLPRIFEPFFTTRAGGTGLGLAIVRRIVEEHSGQIRVDSETGVGTCFVLTLPIDQRTA